MVPAVGVRVFAADLEHVDFVHVLARSTSSVGEWLVVLCAPWHASWTHGHKHLLMGAEPICVLLAGPNAQ